VARFRAREAACKLPTARSAVGSCVPNAISVRGRNALAGRSGSDTSLYRCACTT
jgi:hypothetical protein